jgi:hypothetical protein
MMTDFSKVCNILSQLYINYKDEEDFEDFIEFNDLGLPLAYLASEGLCEVSDDGKKYIMETWELFITSLGIQDEGFDDLEEVLTKAQNKEN